LDRRASKATDVCFADSRERHDSSEVHYTPFSSVLLQRGGFSHVNYNALSNPLSTKEADP
ncbi:MAG TPA: hypothetical protein VNW73_05635, partial [Ktedonobacteraceae bacterium]|nr:hypothetical protein [Ktedonobacteraceae bacterium]